MKVRLKTSRAGYRDGAAFSEKIGQEIEVTSERAKRLIDAGQAEPVAQKKSQRAEKRTSQKRAEKL